MARNAELRRPLATDGPAVHRLIARCPPLDQNSRYCSLLLCTHFADTCVLAERDDDLVGFVSGFVEPRRPDTLFIWQVAVAPEARRSGLTRRMFGDLLAREQCRNVAFVEASVTGDNEPSWQSFQSVAKAWRAPMLVKPWLDPEPHFEGEHAAEYLLRIGPVVRQSSTHLMEYTA